MTARRGAVLLLVIALTVAGCESPHGSIGEILDRQAQAISRLPEEDRARLSDRRLPKDIAEAGADTEPLPQGVLDLEAARRVALRGNPDIHAAEARFEDALARITEARSFYLPDVSVTHSSNRIFQTPNRVTRFPSQIGGANMPALPANPTFVDWFNLVRGPLSGSPPWGATRIETGSHKPFSEHSTALTGQWLIFDSFVREARLLSAQHGSRASAMALADVQRLITEAVDLAYYQVQLGYEQFRIAQSDEQFGREQLELARLNKEAGKITEADVLNFEVRVRAAQANVVAARGAIDTGRVLLAELLGLSGANLGDEVELVALQEETEQELTPPDAEEWIVEAMGLRPDLAGANYILAARSENIVMAKGQFGPEIGLQGTWGFERLHNLRYGGDDQSSAMGVEMRWPLFTGGLRTSQVRRAHAQWWEAVEQLRQKRLQVSSEVRRAVVDVVNAQEQVELRRLNLVSAAENRRIVQTEYAAGKASLVRLNEAQRDLIQTEAELATSRIRLRLAWSQLYSSAGYYVRENASGADGPSVEQTGESATDAHVESDLSSAELSGTAVPTGTRDDTP